LDDTKSILVRLPTDFRDRLNKLSIIMNQRHLGGRFSAQSIASAAIIREIEKLERQYSEQELKEG